ncbi:MAG: calcium-binding EGF-like domain-containing protein [Bacteroidota bacterium]
MKKLLIIALTSCSLFLFDGCKKKKSEEPANPCANTMCLNGGTCVDGSCSCPTGYMGADCGTQKTPTKVTISAIKVTKFPAMDGSVTWDPTINTNPDMFAVIKQGSTTLITTASSNNISAGATTVLSGVSPYDVTNLTSQLNIELWDEDTPPIDANDSMGNINFSIYDSSNHFPTTLTVDNGTLTFEITLSYTY